MSEEDKPLRIREGDPTVAEYQDGTFYARFINEEAARFYVGTTKVLQNPIYKRRPPHDR